MNRRVLVTGLEGFTGRYLAPLLVDAGYEVHGTVGHSPGERVDGPGERYACDLTDAAQVARTVDAVQPHAVVHLAGVSFVGHGDVESIYRINLLGSRNLLDSVDKLPVRPASVLLASSANVYGNGAEGVMDETTPTAPANDYAVSKLAMEYMARLYTRLPVIIARPFNYTGVGQSQSFLLPKIVAHIRQGSKSIELGNLDVARDFSDVRTVAGVYLRLLDSPRAAGQTLNVCSGKAYTLREVLATAQEIAGRTLEIRINPSFVRPNEVKRLLGSRTRLEACIGEVESIDLRDTLRWMIEAA